MFDFLKTEHHYRRQHLQRMHELESSTRLNVKTEKEIDVWIYLLQDIERTRQLYPDTALTVDVFFQCLARDKSIQILEIALGRDIEAHESKWTSK